MAAMASSYVKTKRCSLGDISRPEDVDGRHSESRAHQAKRWLMCQHANFSSTGLHSLLFRDSQHSP